MIKQVDLKTYLPPFIQEYPEAQKIVTAENPEFQSVWDEDEIIRNNLYFTTATERGLQRFEKVMRVYPSMQDTIESRRGKILVKWNDSIPYTLETLYSRLSMLCGNDFELIPHFTEYMLKLITHLDSFGGVDDLAYILRTVLPANIEVDSSNILDFKAEGKLFIGSTTSASPTYLMTNDFDSTYALNGAALNGSTMIASSQYMMTNDFETVIQSSGTLNAGSTSIVETIYEI